MDTSTSGNALLQETYDVLGLNRGRLLDAGESQKVAGVDSATWTTTGEWLSLAGRMGAEKVFFVEDDPVLVFAALPDSPSLQDWMDAYRSAWCLARPQCVFLATPDELRVYSLAAPPAPFESGWASIKPLEVIRRTGEVASKLARFDRGQVESGEAFAGRDFATRDHRADRQLLSDVRRATAELIADGLSAPTAHALIERVLLVRYLEDRGVVTREYFARIADGRSRWERSLNSEPPTIIANRAQPGFEAVLGHRAFAFAVFDQLAADFNGDLFIVSRAEAREVTQSHLDRVRQMLLGDTDPASPPLFLWAYDFSIVPTSLISSMYEQFFHSAVGDDPTGTHYTPPELVQYVVNQVLTPEILSRSPRVLDPACGSGIFLVEAFRAIVRFESDRRGRRLRANELRALLLNRIAGIDINAEAVRLAAFSLYLALLNYQRPQDILEAGPLPALIADEGLERFSVAVGDTFDFAPGEIEDDEAGSPTLPWSLETFDVVVGNPPWTEPPGGTTTQEDSWVNRAGRYVGDRSPSQAFIWRSLSLLRPEGVFGLLVGAGVIANARSLPFRHELLDQVAVGKVVNFSDARGLFFSNATAPFLFLQAAKAVPGSDHRFPYLMVRRSSALARTGSLSFGHMDRRMVRQADLRSRDYLWKTYAWGSHQDASLLSLLDAETDLAAFLDGHGLEAGCGWQWPTKKASVATPDFFSDIPVMDVKAMETWGPLQDSWFSAAPPSVAFPTKPALYHGQRIIMTRRARAGFGPSARLEDQPFSFRHTAYGIPLQGVPGWQAKVILATLMSSLGRYSLFMRAGRWGPWYDEVTQEEILTTPLRLTNEADPITERVVSAIDALRDHEPDVAPIFAAIDGNDIEDIARARLDEAVFDLFGLSAAQRELVEDFHAAQRDLAERRRRRSGDGPRVEMSATTRGTSADLDGWADARGSLGPYLRAFLGAWNRELGTHGELSWEVHRASSLPILCVVFETKELAAALGPSDDEREWSDVLSALELAIERPVGSQLFVDGVVRAVTDTEIVVAKRDEQRLWSASAAREDVEATMLRVMALQRR